MATLRGYKCTKCGYVVMADASVYEAFMFVTNYYLPLQEQYPICPRCGRMDGLRTWNPVEGHCPKCGESKLSEKGKLIMAD